MSNTRALALIDEAALRIADPAYTRISVPKWTSFFNKRARQLATRLKLKKRRALFSTEADNEIHTYPQNLVVMTALEFTTSPTDRKTFRPVKELEEDEFKAATANNYPTGDPTHYFADQGFLFLVPMPAAVYTNGLRMSYWGLPDAVVDPAVDYLPFAEHMRDVLLEGMIGDGLQVMEKFDAAAMQEQSYERLIGQSELRLEDRSEDRRQSFRPSTRVRGYSGQV